MMKKRSLWLTPLTLAVLLVLFLLSTFSTAYELVHPRRPGQLRLNLWQGDTLRDRRTFPLPRESSWNPTTLALSPSPNKLCLLASKYDCGQSPYAIICADILREVEKR